jgi:hypothetical protein
LIHKPGAFAVMPLAPFTAREFITLGLMAFIYGQPQIGK